MSDGDASSDLALQAAWQAAFTLETWYFIARGAGDQVTPLAFETPEGGIIAVFTSKDRGLDFGLSIGLPEEEAGFQLAVPRTECVEWLLQFVEDGVSAAVLDPGTADAAVILAALPHLEQLALAASDDGDDDESDEGAGVAQGDDAESRPGDGAT
ncbi:hypothetical protein [Salana multivorans]